RARLKSTTVQLYPEVTSCHVVTCGDAGDGRGKYRRPGHAMRAQRWELQAPPLQIALPPPPTQHGRRSSPTARPKTLRALPEGNFQTVCRFLRQSMSPLRGKLS